MEFQDSDLIFVVEHTVKLYFKLLFLLDKTDAEICHTYLHIQTNGNQLAFVFGAHWEQYLAVLRLYEEHALEYKYLILAI